MRPLGTHPGSAGAPEPHLAPRAPLSGAPPSQEPASQAWLWSGDFLSFKVLEKVLFLPLGPPGAPGQPPAPDHRPPPPLFIPLFSEGRGTRGWGTSPGGASQRRTVREKPRGEMKWKKVKFSAGGGRWRWSQRGEKQATPDPLGAPNPPRPRPRPGPAAAPGLLFIKIEIDIISRRLTLQE